MSKRKREGERWIPPKQAFLRKAHELTFTVRAEPKKLGKGFGWSKAGGRSTQPLGDDLGGSALCSGPTFNGNVLNYRDCGLELDAFMSGAEPLDFEIQTLPYEFSTGSLGWEGHMKRTVTVAGKTLQLQCNLNCPILGSKGDDTVPPAAPENKKILEALEVIGKATATEKDDLKRVSGIGPFIEARLHGIGIFTFQQIANMTPEIEDDVNEAIEYFPGRVRRDQWVAQCKEFARKKSGDSKGRKKKASLTKQKKKLEGEDEAEEEEMDDFIVDSNDSNDGQADYDEEDDEAEYEEFIEDD